MTGGNTDTPAVLLDFCMRFPKCVNELLKRVTGARYAYFTNPVASYYLQPTLGNVAITFSDLANFPKPAAGCLSKKQVADLRVWAQQNGKCVRLNTTRNFPTKDKPGTLPINFHESAPPKQQAVDFEKLGEDQSTNPQNRDNEASDLTRKVAILHPTYVLVSQRYRPNSMPVSPLHFAKLLEDVTERLRIIKVLVM